MAPEPGLHPPGHHQPAQGKTADKQSSAAMPAPEKPTETSRADPAGEKKLSNAELKKRAKEEKAARRAAAKTVPILQPSAAAAAAAASSAAGGSSADGKATKPRPKQDAQPPTAHLHARTSSRSAVPLVQKETTPHIPESFSHLSMSRRVALTQADKDVHAAVLALGQHMSAFSISDSITRLEAMLLAFKKVIDAYTTPHGATFSRHFTSHVLNPQIEYLTACRPMCFAMGNAIRWLKLQISKLDIDLPDLDAKKLLCQSIDNFIYERIILADFVIVKTAAEMIADDDVVLTYAHHHLVERTLLAAQAAGGRFRVIVIDDPREQVGVALAKRLAAASIRVSYASDLGALRANLQEATMFLAAAEAMFSNGAMYARAGTSDIATVATDMRLRVIAMCESINFTERVSIDSLTYEVDPQRHTHKAFRMLFDTTRDKFISVVVTELGHASAKSVPAILRKLEEL